MDKDRDVIACDFSGAGSGERICAFFRDAISDAGRSDIVRVKVEELSATAARARAMDSEGAILFELHYDVIDAELNENMWRDFAAGFAGHELKTDR